MDVVVSSRHCEVSDRFREHVEEKLARLDKHNHRINLVEVLLEKEAQEYFAEETFEYPLADGVEAAEGVPPLDSLRPPPGEQPDELGDIATTGKLIAEAGLN